MRWGGLNATVAVFQGFYCKMYQSDGAPPHAHYTCAGHNRCYASADLLSVSRTMQPPQTPMQPWGLLCTLLLAGFLVVWLADPFTGLELLFSNAGSTWASPWGEHVVLGGAVRGQGTSFAVVGGRSFWGSSSARHGWSWPQPRLLASAAGAGAGGTRKGSGSLQSEDAALSKADTLRGVTEEILKQCGTGAEVCQRLDDALWWHWYAPRVTGPARQDVQREVVRLGDAVTPLMDHFSSADAMRFVELLLQLTKWDSVFGQQFSRGRCNLVDGIAGHIAKPHVLNELNVRELSRVVWAFGKMRIVDAELVKAIGTRLTQPSMLEALLGMDISMIVLGLAWVNSDNRGLLDTLSQHVTHSKVINDFDAQSISNTA